jgi:beta-hydroxylase
VEALLLEVVRRLPAVGADALSAHRRPGPSIPTVHAALFAFLPPGGKLAEHRDPYAGSLRYHLGLITPNSDACRILVDGQPYAWRDGEDVVFDATYIHRADNRTDQARLILFCDVERPLKTSAMRALNRFVAHHVAHHFSTTGDGTPAR